MNFHFLNLSGEPPAGCLDDILSLPPVGINPLQDEADVCCRLPTVPLHDDIIFFDVWNSGLSLSERRLLKSICGDPSEWILPQLHLFKSVRGVMGCQLLSIISRGSGLCGRLPLNLSEYIVLWLFSFIIEMVQIVFARFISIVKITTLSY